MRKVAPSGNLEGKLSRDEGFDAADEDKGKDSKSEGMKFEKLQLY